MLQVNTNFACDLLTTEYHKQVLEAIITLATSDIPCTCNDVSAMVYLRLFTLMATRNNRCIMLCELSSNDENCV